MRVAVEGCSHGELDHIYERVLAREHDEGQAFDVLLLCGDFQAIRNHADLHSLAVPQKYRQLGSFWQYYAGVKTAPLLTIVIGGNHEASNYMFELYYGGWLAPNIYFLGEAGCVEVGDLIISGISGIYKRHDYYRGRYERYPYDKNDLRSIYHTRIYDVERLKLLPRTDIHMSHDWPNTIELHGNTQQLIKKKPFFADEIRTHTLGSPPLLELLQTLKPLLWCSAHLHIRFDALYHHSDASGKPLSGGTTSTSGLPITSSVSAAPADPNEIVIDDFDDSDDGGAAASNGAPPPATPSMTTATKVFEDTEEPLVTPEEVAAPPPSQHGGDSDQTSLAAAGASGATFKPRASTQFLALGKCVKHQGYLEFLTIEGEKSSGFKVQPSRRSHTQTASGSKERQVPTLRFHLPWLAIVRALHPWLSLTAAQKQLPSRNELAAKVAEAEKWLLEKAGGSVDVSQVQRFVQTAPPPPPESLQIKNIDLRRIPPTQPQINPQTAAFCALVGIDLRINVASKVPPTLLDTSERPNFEAPPEASSSASTSAQ